MMEDYDMPDDKKGLGCFAWTMATIGLAIALAMFSCGCEDGGDRTVVNDESINTPTNDTATITSLDINGNQNTTLVYVESAPGVTQVVEVDVHGNSNLVGVIYKQPQIPEPEPAP